MEGMNDVISKILEKSQPENKTIILSKSKKTKRKRSELKEELTAKKEKLEQKHEEKEKGHTIPTRSNAQNEVLLKRIATKGVVKLFNAVNTHQKTMSSEMKDIKTEAKKEKKAKVIDTKSNFMDLLKKKETLKENKNQSKKKSAIDSNGEEENTPSEGWKVFRDDFMMGASMKAWDKQAEGESSDDAPPDDDSDDQDSGSE